MQCLLKFAALAFLSVGATAQSGLDLQPCNEVQDAGTLNLVSGVLTPANGTSYFLTEAVIYDNTCPTPSFSALLSGNTNLDEGRLPSTSSAAPAVGTFNKYRVTKFVIGYCTRELAVTSGGPGAQVTVNFYENYSPCTASTANPPAVATFALTGLPASTTLGALSCWTVTIDLNGGAEFYMLADANGVFDATNGFGFSYSFPGQTGTTTATVGGPLAAGDVTAPGDCAAGSATYYNTPGALNGTGLDNGNFFFREGTTAGQTTNACLFFGAPPALHAGFYMKMFGDLDDCNANANPDADDISSGSSLDVNGNSIPDECDCGATSTYCTAGTTSNGCVPSISSSGAASASAGSGFTISVANVEGQKSGLLFYGINGQASSVWASGSTSFLCVKSPSQRMGTQLSGGSNGACDGALSEDWNLYLATHPTSLGQPFMGGETVWAQAWFRDPPAPKTTNLSNGLEFNVCP